MSTGVAHAIIYIAAIALLATSTASALIDPRGNWHQIGASFRMVCPVIIMALPLVLLGTNLEFSWMYGHVVIFMTLAAIAIWVIIFAKRLGWRRSWAFPYPLVQFPRTKSGGVDGTASHLFDFTQHRGSKSWIFAWGLRIIGLICTMVMLWAIPVMPTLDSTPEWALGTPLAGLLIGGALLNYSRMACLRVRRAHAPIIPSPDSLSPGSYVLHLRTFDYDTHRASVQPIDISRLQLGTFDTLISGWSEEEQLAEAVRPVGQMVAVGIPGEKIPHAGAVRMYLPKNDWRQPVSQLLQNSRLVVIQLGSGAGTIWEVVESIYKLPPQRIFLIIPPEMEEGEYTKIRKEISKGLRSRAAYHGEIVPWRTLPSLPPYPPREDTWHPEIGFVRFAGDWTAHMTFKTYLPISPVENIFTILTHGMGETFERLAAYESETVRHCG